MRFSLPFLPTERAAWAAAATAPIAVIIAALAPNAWLIAPIALLGLLVLIGVDALIAGRLEDWQLDIPADTELGTPTALGMVSRFGKGASSSVTGALEFDTRLGDGGRAFVPLKREAIGAGGSRSFSGAFEAEPVRRGTAGISRMWLRWAGPLGLGARQITRDTEEELRIWPNIAPVRSPEMQTFLRDAQFGLIARRIRGEGTQFEALSEYEAGMDRRRIDWKASARHTKLYARENESERNNQIVFAFDCGQTMCEPVDGLPRIDRAVTAALTSSYVALKGGDKIALFGFAQKPTLMTPFVADSRAFHRLQSAAAGLDYHSAETNFTLALATLTAHLKRRSMVVIFSDFTDPTAAEMMVESIGRLVDRHLVLFVTIEDSELEGFVAEPPQDLDQLAQSVTAASLAHQRAIVLQRLRQLGVDVIEAPWNRIGYQLIDKYFEIKQSEAIG
jgi:uncharacterized protein (DUF58 family)